jgi:acyl-CoA thioester hydrolase
LEFALNAVPAEPSRGLIKSSPGLFSQLIRIYFEDTDAGGIVYHASWLRFFERARTDWLREMGITQAELARTQGLGFVVRDLQIEYLRPARLDDLIQTELSVADLRRASLRLEQRAQSADGSRRLVDARVRIAVIDLASGRPRPLPDALMDRLQTDTMISEELRSDAT